MTTDLPWRGRERAEWLREARAWTAAELGPLAEWSVYRDRPWSLLAKVRTTAVANAFFFKAVEPARRFELSVTTAVAARWPSLAPEVLAADTGRHWMLLADHGPAMRDAASPGRQVDLVGELLPAYAEMQRSTLDHVDGWIAEGVPDRRPEHLAGQFEAFADGLDDAELRAACGHALPELAAACGELAAASPPEALDHADIHGTNVVVDGAGPHLIDWGDCCIAHPFSSLFAPRHFLVAALPAKAQGPAWHRIRDAYLEGWGGPSAENLDLLRLAMWTAPAVRVLALAAEAGSGGEIAELLRAWPVTPPRR